AEQVLTGRDRLLLDRLQDAVLDADGVGRDVVSHSVSCQARIASFALSSPPLVPHRKRQRADLGAEVRLANGRGEDVASRHTPNEPRRDTTAPLCRWSCRPGCTPPA